MNSNLKPTEKQLSYAKKLGIEGAELLSRKELGKLIEKKLKEKKEVIKEEVKEEKKEIVEENRRDDLENVYEFYGNTNIQNSIFIEIPIQENREIFILMKKKRLYPSSPSLLEEFKTFLKRLGAKKEKDKIIIKSGKDEDVYSPAYILSTLESFFIKFSWRYA